ncbi:MAG: terminase small subunit [Rhodospirillales bacterium]|nr:terminase small subunit [Rhodospirillales bacterium]
MPPAQRHPSPHSPDVSDGDDDDLFNPDTLPDLTDNHPLNVTPPDYRNPMSGDAPLSPDMRARWLEERGYDPKAEADLKRHNAEGVILNGEFVCDPEPGDLDLIRDGIEHDECPDLPTIPAQFDMKPRWESFCRLYAFGHSAADAARHAGYSWGTSRHAGWRLLQDPRIRRRISTLQEFAHDQRPQCREDLSVRLETVYREAMNRGQYNAAVRALDLISRMEGYWATRHNPEQGCKSGQNIEAEKG